LSAKPARSLFLLVKNQYAACVPAARAARRLPNAAAAASGSFEQPTERAKAMPMRKQYAIYETRDPQSVRLVDGAWIRQQHCFKGPMRHTPRLFSLKRDAVQWMRDNVTPKGYATVREYDGPVQLSK
jgi:hypothetical protein